MKTTLDLPDELVRAVKIRAVQENRTLKDLVADLLRRGLDQPTDPAPVRHRVQSPLIEGTRPARPEEEATPERIAQVLLDQEIERFAGPAGR